MVSSQIEERESLPFSENPERLGGLPEWSPQCGGWGAGGVTAAPALLLPPPCPAKPSSPHTPRSLCPWRRNTWFPPTFSSWKPDDSTRHCRQRELMASCLTPLWPGISRAQESRVVNLGFLMFLLFSGHLTTSKSKDPKRSV